MVTVSEVLACIGKAKIQVDVSGLEADTVFSDLGVDSLDIMDMFLEVQDEFSVEVADDQIEALDTAQKIADFINQNN